MFMNIAPEFISDNRSLCTPETGCNKDCICFSSPFNKGNGTGYGKLQVT